MLRRFRYVKQLIFINSRYRPNLDVHEYQIVFGRDGESREIRARTSAYSREVPVPTSISTDFLYNRTVVSSSQQPDGQSAFTQYIWFPNTRPADTNPCRLVNCCYLRILHGCMFSWFLYDDSSIDRAEAQTTENMDQQRARPPLSRSISSSAAKKELEPKPEFDDLDPAVTAAILTQVREKNTR